MNQDAIIKAVTPKRVLPMTLGMTVMWLHQSSRNNVKNAPSDVLYSTFQCMCTEEVDPLPRGAYVQE